MDEKNKRELLEREWERERRKERYGFGILYTKIPIIHSKD